MLSKVWTTEDDRRLLRLHAAGRSTFSISAALKRSSSAIRTRLTVLRARQRQNAASGRREAARGHPHLTS